jgi:predicted nucleic acid-binding protein
VLIDTNIALDVLLKRTSYYEKSARVLLLSEKKEIEAYISASAVTDVYYVTRKALQDKRAAIDLLRKLVSIVNVAAVTEGDVYQALESEWDDFEDSIQNTVGENLSAEYIITRNPQDFKSAYISVVTPEQFLSLYGYLNDIIDGGKTRG